MDDQALIDRARSVLNPRKLSAMADAGGVGCALLTKAGNVYTGVCVDTMAQSLCAERVAIGAMVTAGESRITTIAAVDWDGVILAPCGTCREFIWQVHKDNRTTRILLPKGQSALLGDLLPHHWWRGEGHHGG